MPVTNNNEAKYNLVFARKIKSDTDIDIVKEKLRIFFNNKPNVVEQLFLKEKIILKKDLSKEQALKYKLFFETTGAECSIYKVKSTNTNNTDTHKVDNSTAAAGSLAKSPNISKKIVWALVILIVLLIVSWAGLHFVNSDYTTAIDANKSDSAPAINYLLF